MSARRTTTSVLCLLAALALVAIAAPGAGAATKGTTAFTCVKGQGTLRGEHCTTTGTAAAEFGHVAIAENTTTEVSGSNQKTGMETNVTSVIRLKGVVNGTALELSAEGVELTNTPWMENKKAASGEHYIHGEGRIKYTKVKVTKPLNSGCVVFEDEEVGVGPIGVVTTTQLTATTEAQGDALLVRPAKVGTPLATFYLAECKPPFEGLNGTHTVLGKIKTTSIEGATLTTSHANTTVQGTLFLDNEFTPFGLDGTLTISGRAKGGGAYTPLSPTTVETP